MHTLINIHGVTLTANASGEVLGSALRLPGTELEANWTLKWNQTSREQRATARLRRLQVASSFAIHSVIQCSRRWWSSRTSALGACGALTRLDFSRGDAARRVNGTTYVTTLTLYHHKPRRPLSTLFCGFSSLLDSAGHINTNRDVSSVFWTTVAVRAH